MDYGKWFKGWVRPEGESGNLFRVTWDTDIYQDDFATGATESYGWIGVEGDGEIITIRGPIGFSAPFNRGLRSDTLPPVPWEEGSC